MFKIKFAPILMAAAFLLLSGCSFGGGGGCTYQDKSYGDGNAVFLRQRQNICLCEETHWICIPVSGGMEQGQREEM